MTVNDLHSSEYSSYFQPYIDKVEQKPLIQCLEEGKLATETFFQDIPTGKQEFRYAEGKWTPKEILLHLSDSERMFCYRAMSFARSDNANLPGYDENEFALNSNANKRSMDDIIVEFSAVRAATISLFKSFSDEALMRKGTANNNTLSVRAAGFLICGHEIHHRKVISNRYL
ncbi:MAG: DinB family protein [Bacteroidia bacterium]|nr:DinB family protein [Bacteroidia bacterium]NNF30043.1 DinB family protein [Flavobacteriaceae bacterium]NNJ81597.1 DinB family protein [Flavobacteriaceae bacterium]NNK55018.1 DinB family protein [Flavobacteriaceae bacterium]NNM09231.1 DinB family protein [Flavobacteriaceae bacterium]